MGQPFTYTQECGPTGCKIVQQPTYQVEQPVQQQWQTAACDAYSCRPQTPGKTVSVDGQTEAQYKEQIAKVPYHAADYGKALSDAAKLNKPIVAMFGSWEECNSRKLIDMMDKGIKNKDAIYLYVDPKNCSDPALKKFAEDTLKNSGGYNTPVSIVFDVKPDANKNPVPTPYSFRLVGDHPSYKSDLENAIKQAQERQSAHQGKFKADLPAPPQDKPKVQEEREKPKVDDHERHGKGKRHGQGEDHGEDGGRRKKQKPHKDLPNQLEFKPLQELKPNPPKGSDAPVQPPKGSDAPVQPPKGSDTTVQPPKGSDTPVQPPKQGSQTGDGVPKEKAPAPQPVTEKPADAPQDWDALLKSRTVKTFEQYKNIVDAKKIYDGDPATGKPGYKEVHQQLLANLKELTALTTKPNGLETPDARTKVSDLLKETKKHLDAEQDILRTAYGKIKDIPGAKAIADQLVAKGKESADVLKEPNKALSDAVIADFNKQRDIAAQKAKELQQANEKQAKDLETAQKDLAVKANQQAADGLRQDHFDSQKWQAQLAQTTAKLDERKASADTRYPGAKDVVAPGTPLELLRSDTARAKATKAADSWYDKTNHDKQADVLETQRNRQFRQLVDDVSQPGDRTDDRTKKEKLLYDAVTKFGEPFSGSKFKIYQDGTILNHGSMWVDRCADTMVASCDPKLDRKVAADTVPLALTNNNVTEGAKVKLLDGLKKLSEPGTDGKPAITRDEEVAILTKALSEDQKKNIDASSYAYNMNPDHTQGFKNSDKANQVEFQKKVMERLAELKAVETTDVLTATKSHPNPAIARAAAEALAKMHPSVNELRAKLLSNPLQSADDRRKAFEEEFSFDRADKRPAAVIRHYGKTQFDNATDPAFQRMVQIADSNRDDTATKLAAAAVLSQAKVEEGKAKAAKVAADVFCADNPIPQHKEAAAKILDDIVGNGQRNVTLSDGRVVVITRNDGKVSYAVHKR